MRLIRLLQGREFLLLVTSLVKAPSRRFEDFLAAFAASVPPTGGRKHPQQELIYIDTTNILFICGGAFVILM